MFAAFVEISSARSQVGAPKRVEDFTDKLHIIVLLLLSLLLLCTRAHFRSGEQVFALISPVALVLIVVKSSIKLPSPSSSSSSLSIAMQLVASQPANLFAAATNLLLESG